MSNYIDSIVNNNTSYDLASKPLSNAIADDFSASSTYSVGDYIMYDYKLYKCISPVTTAGTWKASNWQECKITDNSVRYDTA